MDSEWRLLAAQLDVGRLERVKASCISIQLIKKLSILDKDPIFNWDQKWQFYIFNKKNFKAWRKSIEFYFERLSDNSLWNICDYSGFANEAVDALRATEDYTKIKLNKGHTQKAVKEVAGGKEQLQETLLVQIKGRD